MKAQEKLVLIVMVSVGIVAFSLPFLLIGERLDTHDDIILLPRFTGTVTPPDRALTRDAFSLLFFSPTSTRVGSSFDGTFPNLLFTPTYSPEIGLTTIPIPTLWGATYTPTATRPGDFHPYPTATWTLTLSPSPTYTFAPIGTQTILPDTLTPIPAVTLRLTNTVRPTNTIKPKNTIKPSNTPRPTNTPKPPKPTHTNRPNPNSTPTP